MEIWTSTTGQTPSAILWKPCISKFAYFKITFWGKCLDEVFFSPPLGKLTFWRYVVFTRKWECDKWTLRLFDSFGCILLCTFILKVCAVHPSADDLSCPLLGQLDVTQPSSGVDKSWSHRIRSGGVLWSLVTSDPVHFLSWQSRLVTWSDWTQNRRLSPLCSGFLILLNHIHESIWTKCGEQLWNRPGRLRCTLGWFCHTWLEKVSFPSHLSQV